MESLKKPNKKKKINETPDDKYVLRLYVVGNTPNCISALNNLKKICEQHLPKRYEIEVIDLLKLPDLAKDDQILAIPTVIRRLPKPPLKAIGNLSNVNEVLLGLELPTLN